MILFEPPTSEHISARTIFDPITALAPATDCCTYAIGYVKHWRNFFLEHNLDILTITIGTKMDRF